MRGMYFKQRTAFPLRRSFAKRTRVGSPVRKPQQGPGSRAGNAALLRGHRRGQSTSNRLWVCLPPNGIGAGQRTDPRAQHEESSAASALISEKSLRRAFRAAPLSHRHYAQVSAPSRPALDIFHVLSIQISQEHHQEWLRVLSTCEGKEVLKRWRDLPRAVQPVQSKARTQPSAGWADGHVPSTLQLPPVGTRETHGYGSEHSWQH